MRTRLSVWEPECLAVVSEKKDLVMDSMSRRVRFTRHSPLRRFDYHGGGGRMALKRRQIDYSMLLLSREPHVVPNGQSYKTKRPCCHHRISGTATTGALEVCRLYSA